MIAVATAGAGRVRDSHLRLMAIRRGMALLAAALAVAAGAPGRAAADDYTAPPGVAAAPAPMMRLGGRERDRPRSDDGLTTERRATRDCRKLKALAGQLGETFAGHRLRSALLDRTCGLDQVETHHDDVWSWPWRSPAADDLPPVSAGRFGSWEVRCGAVGRRQRCALLHVVEDSTGSNGAERISTHFIMDAVAGRESVVWRVVVSGAAQSDRVRPGERSVPREAHTLATSVTLAHDEHEVRIAFAMCREGACIMEAGPRHSSDVVGRLADGRPIEIRLTNDKAEGTSIVLPAAGFRAGFNALGRLRREELRGPR